jgi:hypothetical protein
MALEGLPLVTDKTRAQSENVETVVTRLRNERIVIPDYQRDAEQWDKRKESLFIESILNNLTVPAFFFSEGDDQKIEVVDGQQRLTTILKYVEDKFALSDEASMVYLTPQSVYYSGKRFSELPKKLQSVFNDYPLTIIYLPQSLDLSTKLEIFRRINEGGTPLTGQDIRLAYYSSSPSVTTIRLAGVHGNGDAVSRMQKSAKERNIPDPWENWTRAYELWGEWWEGKLTARGQTPSEMFLWYLVTLNRESLHSLLSTPNQMKHLKISFRGSTEEALDVYCAQILWTDEHGSLPVFPGGKDLQKDFNSFATWIEYILKQGLSGVSVDKYKQTALLIGALVDSKVQPSQVSHDAWDEFGTFIRYPRKTGQKWLADAGGYPEQKGRWGGTSGQYMQCKQVCKLVSKILESYPNTTYA